jgi:hypothetical protein
VHRILFFFVCISLLPAQEPGALGSETAEEVLLDDVTESEDVRLIGEDLEYLRQHPVNIVRPSYGELLRVPFISPLLAESIILFTDSVSVVDIDQLRSVELMTPKLFERIAPYITAESPSSVPGLDWLLPEKSEFRTRYERKLQTTNGFSQKKYLGDPVGSYQRIRLENSLLEFALMTEKDPGEVFRDRFTSRYAELKDVGIVRRLILGNYSAGFGQGLVFSRNMAASKGSDVTGQIRKRGSAITPSVSGDEFRFFDGGAAQMEIFGMSFTGFYSRRNLPASADSNKRVTSFYTPGLYRNELELSRRNKLSEKVLGCLLQFPIYHDVALMMTAMNTVYGSEIDPGLYHLNGRRSVSAGSVGWDGVISGFKTFGEIASDDAGILCSIAGVTVPVSRSLIFSYLRRDYGSGYAAPFSHPFGERYDIGEGESGDYLGMELDLGTTSVSAFIDQYRFPEGKGSFPEYGNELFGQITHDVTPKSAVLFQVRKKYSYLESENEKVTYRVNHNYRLTRNMSVVQRIDLVRYSDIGKSSVEKGLLASIECNYSDRPAGISVRSRMSWFRSTSYASRLYQYEPDVPGNYSNPPLYGAGLRWFLLVRYEVLAHCFIGLKYSETKKLHETVIGSGDDQIIGNMEGRIAAQLDFRF